MSDWQLNSRPAVQSRMQDPPPILGPEEKPDAAELGRLALQLLHELAQTDANVAERMRDLGIGPDA